jgi:hypothetical protein
MLKRVDGATGKGAARLAMLPMEPGSLVMERKMLRGIRDRAEGQQAVAAPS